MSETVLIERITKGDSAAFEYLIIKYQKQLYSTVLNIMKDEEHAKDIVQEAF